MIQVVYVAYAVGGALLANSIPHVANGMSGRRFPTPISAPGESSATLNVFWGALNLAAGYVFLHCVGNFQLTSVSHTLAAGLGGLLLAVFLARHFASSAR